MLKYCCMIFVRKIGSTVLRWVFEAGLLAVSAWADRIKRRGNGLQNRLALVKANFEDLHETWLYENGREACVTGTQQEK